MNQFFLLFFIFLVHSVAVSDKPLITFIESSLWHFPRLHEIHHQINILKSLRSWARANMSRWASAA